MQKDESTPFIIPVVVHVIYNNSTENISQEQIVSQLEVLNQDYRKLNSDIVNIPELFSNLAADCNIEFRLAQYDPQGNATTGITRTQTSISIFYYDDDFMKFTSSGGQDIWDRERYLNIWVCDLEDSVLGYSSFPVWDPSTDGVVIDYEAFGTTGTAQAPYNLGRTAVHEIGHWLGLYHIWGDDEERNNDPSNDCEGDDLVYDTPNQAISNIGCPTFPHPSCSNESDMFMNYMDYVDDQCMFMFSTGQKQRIQSTIFVTRSNLNPSLNLSQNIFSQVPENGANYSFDLTNPNPYNDINWSITKNVDWITNITPISGTDDASISFSVSSNQTGKERAGIITIATDDTYQSQLYIFVFQESNVNTVSLRLSQQIDNGDEFKWVRLYRMGEWKPGNAPKYYEVENGALLTMQFYDGLRQILTANFLNQEIIVTMSGMKTMHMSIHFIMIIMVDSFRLGMQR